MTLDMAANIGEGKVKQWTPLGVGKYFVVTHMCIMSFSVEYVYMYTYISRGLG